jgi:hypothetical protein
VTIPFAKIPSNCFLALVASTVVSKNMWATPEERPLRSYLKCENRTDSGVGLDFFQVNSVHSEVRTLICGSRMSVPICPKIVCNGWRYVHEKWVGLGSNQKGMMSFLLLDLFG